MLQDLEVKATKFREHANGMPQGESWTVGLDDSRKLDWQEFLTHGRNKIGTNKQVPGIRVALIAVSAAHDEALDTVSQFTCIAYRRPKWRLRNIAKGSWSLSRTAVCGDGLFRTASTAPRHTSSVSC